MPIWCASARRPGGTGETDQLERADRRPDGATDRTTAWTASARCAEMKAMTSRLAFCSDAVPREPNNSNRIERGIRIIRNHRTIDKNNSQIIENRTKSYEYHTKSYENHTKS